jgi:hypothetical protein
MDFAEAALSVHSSCASLSTGITFVSSCLLVGRAPFAGLHEARSPSIGSVIRTDARKLGAAAHIGAGETARPPILSSSETPIEPASPHNARSSAVFKALQANGIVSNRPYDVHVASECSDNTIATAIRYNADI